MKECRYAVTFCRALNRHFSLLIVFFITILFHPSPFIKNAPTWRIFLWNMHALRPLPEGEPFVIPPQAYIAKQTSRFPGCGPYAHTEKNTHRKGTAAFCAAPCRGTQKISPFPVQTVSRPISVLSELRLPPAEIPRGRCPAGILARHPASSKTSRNVPEHPRPHPPCTFSRQRVQKNRHKAGFLLL